jgi:DNA-binding NarL/FixJ family response regulator
MTREFESAVTENVRQESGDELPKLTPREEEVLECGAFGLTSRQTSQCLEISEKTVEKHRGNILSKHKATMIEQVILKVLESGNPNLCLSRLTNGYDYKKMKSLWRPQKEMARSIYMSLKEGHSQKAMIVTPGDKEFSPRIKNIARRRSALYRRLGIKSENKDLTVALLFLRAKEEGVFIIEEEEPFTEEEKRIVLFWAKGKKNSEISRLLPVSLSKLEGYIDPLILRKLDVMQSTGRPARTTAILSAFFSQKAVFGEEQLEELFGAFDFKKANDLTKKQREILETVLTQISKVPRTVTNKSLAAKLFLSPRTIEKHTKNILRELELENMAEATLVYVLAKKRGII